jgi:putative SOS response-associated peptidase YedK
MCFHSALTTEATKLKNRFKANLEEGFMAKKHINAFEKSTLPIITNLHEGVFQNMEWGLIPAWASAIQAEQLRTQTPNARIETILEKPSFRDAILSQRCLVPATGFYEWRHQNGHKFPYFISVKDQEIFSMAGIWAAWVQPNGQIKRTFSILTTEANPLMAQIHNTKQRMPVILKPEDEQKWLKEGHQNLAYFAKPFDENAMQAITIKFNALQSDFEAFQYEALSQQQLGLF